MTDTKELARRAGLLEAMQAEIPGEFQWRPFPDLLERFAQLVREEAVAGERERCAKVCEDLDVTYGDWHVDACELCAEAIRAHGKG